MVANRTVSPAFLDSSDGDTTSLAVESLEVDRFPIGPFEQAPMMAETTASAASATIRTIQRRALELKSMLRLSPGASGARDTGRSPATTTVTPLRRSGNVTR